MFNLNHLQGLFSLLREKFDSMESELNALDSEVGDGDHGFTMSRTMRAAELAAAADFHHLGEGFDAVAESMAENAGGAIGPLLASLFAEGGVIFNDRSNLDPADFSKFLAGGLIAIQEVGGAKPGDKTMVDALAPAAAVVSGVDFPSLDLCLEQASLAARKGAERTREMAAAHGRASFVADRSRGHQDAGATSLALILETWLDYLRGSRSEPGGADKEEIFSPPPGKLVNHPDHMVLEDNQGLALLYPNLVRLSDGILLRAHSKDEGKTALVIGHGGGHTPSMGGFIGPGLLDADVYGPIFTCASGVSIARAIEKGDRGAGVVLLVSNHSGDVLNARLGVRRARQKGVKVEPVLMGDDIATASREEYQKRRGLGGLLFGLKIGGGAAEDGRSLNEVVEIIQRTNQRTATLSVAVKPPTHPATGLPLFELPEGQIEVGTGVHGELGIYRGSHLSAGEIIEMLLEKLVEDIKDFDPRQVLVFINGAGGTSRMELHILYNEAYQDLTSRGIQVAAGVADSFFTTGEMGGFSLSICAADQEMLNYWNYPASSPCFRWPQE